jgi:glutamine synthetase
VARRHGFDATFMAKPYRAQPGNAMRVRAAIARGADGNAFAEGASAADENLRAAIGGLQTVMAESIALFAPNANAYRRFAPGSGVARNKRWAYANRTAVLSVEGEGEARCIEHRVPGADANPYLVLAATFAGIHHGIAAGADPGAPFDGDAAAFVDQTLPLNVDAALVALENAAIMREYLGPPYVDLYCATKRAELARFRDHISPHEYDWYL